MVRVSSCASSQVYDATMRDALAIPTVKGRKTEREKFAGADTTYTLEGLMRDGKALQMGTSHNLGQNFARGFDMRYTDADGEQQLCWTTSWGVSTRTIGALIMCHGDDRGLRLPPAVAPVQAVVLAVRDEVREAAQKLVDDLLVRGVRAHLDDRTNLGFGRRVTDWELKGVPVRVELGPRDLEQNQATIVRRDSGEKAAIGLDNAATHVSALLPDIQAALFAEAETRREQSTFEASTAEDVDAPGFWRIPWRDLGEAGETALAERAYSVRCLVTLDGEVPGPRGEGDEDLVAYVSKA